MFTPKNFLCEDCQSVQLKYFNQDLIEFIDHSKQFETQPVKLNLESNPSIQSQVESNYLL
jgi:hypothetical protein